MPTRPHREAPAARRNRLIDDDGEELAATAAGIGYANDTRPLVDPRGRAIATRTTTNRTTTTTSEQQP